MLHVKLLDDWRCNDDEGTFLNCGGVEGCIIIEITKNRGESKKGGCSGKYWVKLLKFMRNKNRRDNLWEIPIKDTFYVEDVQSNIQVSTK